MSPVCFRVCLELLIAQRIDIRVSGLNKTIHIQKAIRLIIVFIKCIVRIIPGPALAGKWIIAGIMVHVKYCRITIINTPVPIICNFVDKAGLKRIVPAYDLSGRMAIIDLVRVCYAKSCTDCIRIVPAVNDYIRITVFYHAGICHKKARRPFCGASIYSPGK